MSRVLQCMVVLALLAILATPVAAEEGSTVVTYVTADSVYLDTGQSGGLAVGAKLELMRGDTLVAIVEIVDLSTRRAVARITTRHQDPLIGDMASYEIVIAPAIASQSSAGRAAPARRRRSSNIHGRVGLRYLNVDDRLSTGGGFSQTAIDLRVDGTRIPNTPWGFDIDLRSRRTYRSDASVADRSSTRAYRMLVSHGTMNEGWRFAAGRQLSSHLASVSVFDGVSADYTASRWGVGVISGNQPDPVDYGSSSDITEHGVYFRFKGQPGSTHQWDLVSGLIGSYAGSDVNREFLFLLGRYRTRRLWAYASQEIDYNRDWKVDEAGEDSISATSTFLSMNFRASDNFTLRAGYDNRRNVRLIRDRVTPVTEFDDSFRRGAWVGASLRFLKRYRVGLDTRLNGSGLAGDSTSHGLLFSGQGFTSRNISFNGRVSRYSNEQVEGWFYQLDGSLDVTESIRLQAHAGGRDDTNITTIPATDSLQWYGLSLDLYLARRWYATVEAEITDGGLDDFTQYYTTLTYRF